MKRIFTPEEYLAMEEHAPYKSEFFQGEIFAMSGGSANHSTIISNCIISLGNALKGKPCRVFESNMRLLVKRNGLYTYPDATVVGGQVEFAMGRNDTITNPTLIVEVLSPTPHAYDRIKIFALYKALESLHEYLLVDSEQVHATLLRLSNNQWVIEMYDELDAVFRLESIASDVALRDLYDKIEFENKT